MIKLDQHVSQPEDKPEDTALALSEFSLFNLVQRAEQPARAPGTRFDFKKLNLERVLVMRMDNIGDVVMMGPALRALRAALPDASITLMSSPAGGQVAPLLPWIDDVLVSEALWQDPSGKVRFNPERELGLIQTMRAHSFSAAFIFTNYYQSPLPAAYTSYLAGIPFRIGFSRELAGGVLSHVPPSPEEEVHQVDRDLALLESLGISTPDSRLELHVPDEVQQRANQLLESVGIKRDMPFIVLSPGAGAKTRRYDARRYAAVARMVSSEAGLPLLITGSAREAEGIQPVIEVAVESPFGNVHSLVGRTSVPELAAIIRRSSLVITNNTAALHLADAFQRPMVVLYSGAEYVNQWMPRSSRARLLCRPVHCAPCHHTECPYAMECLDIRPDEVAIAALELLGERVYFHIPVKGIGAEI